MNSRISLGSIICGLLLAVFSSVSCAQSLLSLQKEDKLKLSAVVDDQAQYYAQQPFTLTVNIAFYRWFARGTRVNRIEIDGALVQPVSTFSTNSSELIQGQTWTSQQWTFRVFPMQTGQLLLPKISVHISVNDEGNKVVDGMLSVAVEPKVLAIIAPKGLEQASHWVASADYQVEQTWLGEKEHYAPGDAITRVITQTADAVPAMMLTPIVAEKIDGLALYRVTPKLNDKKNRGSLQGIREDRFVYTIESSGSYALPDYTLYAWDSEAQAVDKVVLEGLSLATGKHAAVSGSASEQAEQSKKTNALFYIFIAMLVLVALFLVGYFVKKIQRQEQSREREKNAFFDAVKRGNTGEILESLYAYALVSRGFATLNEAFKDNSECLSIIQPLMASQWQPSSDVATTISTAQASILAEHIQGHPTRSWPWNKAINLSLNPTG